MAFSCCDHQSTLRRHRPRGEQLVREDPAQIGRCPLSIALYTLRDEPGTVHLVYRAPGDGSPGLRQAGALLRRIAVRTASQW